MFIGTAGWAISKEYQSEFPGEGSHLQRYARVFNAVEINSSSYRPHMAKSYLRWAQEVPEHFRFSVKLEKTFIHDCGLRPRTKDLQASLHTIMNLEEKLGVLLVQLPGSMEFKAKDVERFFKGIRKVYQGQLALEPRNPQWMSTEARALYQDFEVTKVEADPERSPGVQRVKGFRYIRLHGSPVIYRSLYDEKFLRGLAPKMKKGVWCIFDNTTFGNATQNALSLARLSSR